MKDSARTNGVQGDGPDDIGRITGVSWRNISITLKMPGARILSVMAC
jgi:hypothetical protein